MHKLQFFLLFIFSSLYVLGQEPAFFTIGKDELRNTDIYSIFNDIETGILYTGTNDGVYRYDQGTFQKIPFVKNTLGTSFFDIRKSPITGKLFCSNLNGQIFTIESDSIKLFFDDKTKTGRYFKYFFQGDQIIAMSDYKISFLDDSGKSTAPSLNNTTGIWSNYIQYNQNDIYFTDTEKSEILKLNAGKIKPLYGQNYHDSHHPKDIHFLQLYTLGSNRIGVTSNGSLMFLDDTLKDNYKKEISERFYKISDHTVIGMNAKNSARILKLIDGTIQETNKFYKDCFIATMHQDERGIIYFGTFGEGIRVTPNLENKKIITTQTILKITASPTNEVYMLNAENEIYKISNEQFIKTPLNSKSKRGIYYYHNNFNSASVFPIDNWPISDIASYNIKDFEPIDKNNFLTVEFGGIHLISIKNQRLDLISRTILKGSDRFTAVSFSKEDSMVYYSTNKGVFRGKIFTNEIKTYRFNDEKFAANSLIFANDQFICGTKRNGVMFFENDSMVSRLCETNGLHSDIVKKIAKIGNHLVILTKADLQVYDLVKKKFLMLSPTAGVFPTSVIDFVCSDDLLWLAEKNAIYSVNLNQLNQIPPLTKLNIVETKTNDRLLNIFSDTILEFTENNLTVQFDYRDLLNRDQAKIYYQLEGLDTNWRAIPVTKNEIVYPYIKSGNYRLKMKLILDDVLLDSTEYRFIIKTPYWEKWWFYLLIIASMLFVTWYIYRIRINYLIRKINIKHELDNSKLTAIRSQMNPHFIFNTLNSIQHLVLSGDKESSYSSINKFASLIRKTLDYSEIETLSLAEEISLMEVYLSLEKLRFKENFNFTITPPEDTKIQIPTMLIQPFIENAIVHGLLHKSGNKKLNIKFELQTSLICTIEDNGIGYEAAKTIKKRQTGNHKSFSLDAIKRRFEILNDYYETELGYKYEQLKPQSDEDIMTRVTIRIPIGVGRQKNLS